jgi:hypothetical protein
VLRIMRSLFIAFICSGLIGCYQARELVFTRSPCGNERMIRLYYAQGLPQLELAERDSLICLCLQSRPCDDPRIHQLRSLPRDLTPAEYAELDSLLDDCSNWHSLRPTEGWVYIVSALVVATVALITYALTNFSLFHAQ